MKTKNLFTTLVTFFISVILHAQAPQKMSFQAVIRNASNIVISKSKIGMRISLLQGTAIGPVVYAETQNTITNFNGLISLQIGTGTIVSGNFSLIDWANGPYFVKTETDPNGGNDYTIVGSSELLSVPYALFALNTGTIAGSIGLTGAKGADGTDGTNGTNGINGIDGIDAINGEPIMPFGHSTQYFRGDKTWKTLNALTVGLDNVDNTSDLNKPISTATAVYVLANSDHYNSISAGNEIFTSSSSDLIANGLSFTPPAGKYFVNFNSQYTIEPADRTGQAQIDLTAVYANLMGRTVTNASHGVGYGAGETLNPGVYRTAGAVTTTGNLTLDAGGDPNAEFIFQFGAALSTGAGFRIILANGASACNVYWIAEGAIALGAATEMKGMLLSNSGAVALGSMSNVQGSLFSSAGSIGIDASSVSKIQGCINNFGSINSFAIFSKSGIVSNAGTSTITGDIASNTGSVSGFEPATINGNIYTSGMSNATANFSVYQNGILIPFSTRRRTSSMNMGEITLQALATIAEGENIDIRWNIDLGIVKMQNRIFTIQHVR